MVTFPIEMFLPGSDISPLEARKQEFYDGLTRWRSAFAGDGAGEAPMIRVEGASVEDALARANHLMLANRWGDGLPLWPPTRERVDWILGGAAAPRGRKLGAFPPRGGVTTVESCAIALAMAGGRPEYLPVLVAAVEAFLDPESGSEALQAASGSAFPVVIVNGPIGAQIRLNCGLRLPRPGSAAAGRRQHRPRAAPPAAEPGRRPARHRHHGQLRRPALHERGLRGGRGEPARRLGAPRRPSATASRRARARSRSPSPTGPRTSGGAAPRRRRPRKTRSRACTAWPTSCACPTWPASPATSTAPRAS